MTYRGHKHHKGGHNRPESEGFVAGDAPVELTFEGDGTWRKNVVGYYEIDDNGRIVDVKIAFENASAQGSGGSLEEGKSSVTLDVDEGDEFGLFVLANAAHTLACLPLEKGHFEMIDRWGRPATVDSKGTLLVFVNDETGRKHVIWAPVYHALAEDEGSQLSTDRRDHSDVEKIDDETYGVDFEDGWGLGNRDFDDVQLTLSLGGNNGTNLAPLFTANNDVVDFDDVVAGTYSGSAQNAMDSDDTVIMATDLDEAIEAGYDPNVFFNAGAGNDTVTGRGLDDMIDGGEGNDILNGGAGNDTLVGGEGDDTINGGVDDDTIDGGSGNDDLNGDGGEDSITGGLGDDSIDGGADNDAIEGGVGNDKIDGGEGDDDIWGDDAAGNTLPGAGPAGWTVGSDATLVFESEGAGYKNVIGYYTVTEDGKITGVNVGFENASQSGSGGNLTPGVSSVPLNVDAGATVGLFIIANGFSQISNLDLDNGHLEFRDGDGNATTSTVGASLVYINDVTDQETVITRPVYHALGAGDDAALGSDSFDHNTVEDGTDGRIQVNFEDLPNLGDKDFNDVVVSLNLGSDAGMFDDTIDGGAGEDTIRGQLGDDTINGGADNDTLDGGVGDDTINGDAGQDTIDGGDGNDILSGGLDADIIDGGSGKDEINGDDGEDTLTGGSGNDTVNGGDDDDDISGNGGNDTLNGDGGEDIIRGGSGDDTIDGGDDNDDIAGGVGNDTIDGGDGNDDIWGDIAPDDEIPGQEPTGWVVGTDATLIFESESAGFKNVIGYYTVDDNGQITGVQIGFENASQTGSGGNLTPGVSSVPLNVPAGSTVGLFLIANGYNQIKNLDLTNGHFEFRDGGDAATLSSENATLVYVNDVTNQETVITRPVYHALGEGDDATLGSDDSDHNTVTDGTDGRIQVNFEDLPNLGDNDFNDVVVSIDLGDDAGTYDDVINGGVGRDDIYGQLGDDTLNGGDDNDDLYGGSGNDLLNGDDGNDDLFGGDGFLDVMNGGAGRDEIEDDDGVIGVDGGEDDDEIQIAFAEDWDNDDDDTTAPVVTGDITGGLGGDEIQILSNNDELEFTIYGDLRAGPEDVGDGHDVIETFGNYAQGTIIMQGGDDCYFGSLDGGNDLVRGGSGNDLIVAGAGKDEMYGGDDNDQLYGEFGNDTLYGEDGDDFLYGQEGDDELFGGAGNDVYYFGRNHGTDTVVDNGQDYNGLVIYWGNTNTGVVEDDVLFTNNQDGSWTITFVDQNDVATGEGNVTFQSNDIDEINLSDFTGGGGTTALIYLYDSNLDDYILQ